LLKDNQRLNLRSGFAIFWRKANSDTLFLASRPPLPVSNQWMLRRLLKQSIAVVVGSLLYFFVLMPHLPPAARHQPFRGIDLGFLVDAWVCLVLYGIIEWLDRKWWRKSPPTASRKH
jgi:hypothetical protein